MNLKSIITMAIAFGAASGVYAQAIQALSISGTALDEGDLTKVDMMSLDDPDGSGVPRDFLFADPTVYTENGKYYAAGTRSFSPAGFTLLESSDLKNWSYARPDSMILLKDRQCWGSQGFWAPHFFKNGDNDYLISYVANERCVIARSNAINGDYTQTVVEPVDNSEGNIDPFIFRDDDGRCYMYHVRFHGGNIISVCELDPQTWQMIPGTVQECFRNTQQWENTGAYPGLVMEGASVVKLDGVYYMFYSANHYMSPDYAVGYAYANSPLGPWTKYEGNPVIHRSIVGEKGSGHGEVFFDNDGVMRYMYHVHNGENKVNPRRTRILTFNVDKSQGHPYRITADPASIFTPGLHLREGLFRCFVKLKEGQFTFSGTDAAGAPVSFTGTCDAPGIYQVTADAGKGTYILTPVSGVSVVGTVTDGVALPYLGNGVFGGEVELTKNGSYEYPGRRIHFRLNNAGDIMCIHGTDMVAVPGDGRSGEELRINPGTYTMNLDLNKGTYLISAPVDPYRICVFGSSVANGQGATNFHGYAYLYGEQLKTRTDRGLSEYPLYTSGVSIGGNTTLNLLDRFDDLIRDHGKYVIFGLSLGNEGIHGTTTPTAVFNQFRDNMLTLIDMARAEGKVPVVMNNYTRTDYNSTDYNYVRQMNMLIHEWDVPSVNTLGAVDDRAGHWATSLRNDDAHPNAQGHKQMMNAIPPSLFDALESGKSLCMERDAESHELSMKAGTNITFTPEESLNAFTVSVRVKVNGAGDLLSFTNGSRGNTSGHVKVGEDGKVSYVAPGNSTPATNETPINDGQYHYVTLTHYYGVGKTVLYVDKSLAFTVDEKLTPKVFTVGTKEPSDPTDFALSELAFWRSAMNLTEIDAHCSGKMLKSSLEIYSPASLPGADAAQTETITCDLPNLAMSLNAATYNGPKQSGIASATADAPASATPVAHYSIDGKSIPADTSGLQIVRYSNGTSRKILNR